jgi:hypothetical protein
MLSVTTLDLSSRTTGAHRMRPNECRSELKIPKIFENALAETTALDYILQEFEAFRMHTDVRYSITVLDCFAVTGRIICIPGAGRRENCTKLLQQYCD